MPTIAVDKAELYKALGREYTTEEFDELCFEFGIELDEDTTDSERPVVDGVQEPPQLKIEIPANRYDMLCFEGIALMLNIFNKRMSYPNYRVVAPPSGEIQTLTVLPETSRIRPYVSAAILRNIKLNKARYNSLISLQDKLHQNLARQRTLVAIGTHDLDKIQGPFTYEARAPEDIRFAPLNQTMEMDGERLMEFYNKDSHIGRYLHIIRDSPVYPIIYDSQGNVLSLPPIINGDLSKITLETRNIFVEMTATDKTKLDICMNILVTAFSQYCQEPFTVEPVKIVSKHNSESKQTPDLTPRETEAEVSYLNSCCGLSLSPEEISKLLNRMCYQAAPSKLSKDLLDISVPVTRADVLHQCDIMEDVAIAYGFNNLPRSVPYNVAEPLTINELADILRINSANAGFSEVMPLILCSHDENFAWLNRNDDGNTAVKLANPKTLEYQLVRTSLLPGLLKSIRDNRHHALPLKIFEVSDVTFKDMSRERKSRNERHFAAAYCGKASGFEFIHGLLDRIMLMLNITFMTSEEELSSHDNGFASYWLEEATDPTFLEGRAGTIHVRTAGKVTRIGIFGILHPTVLDRFGIRYPVSTLEINAEVFL